MKPNGVVKISSGKTILGSGVFLGGRHIITCHHVVQGQRKLRVDDTWDATLKHRDKGEDLALLELEKPLDYPPVPWLNAGTANETIAYAAHSSEGNVVIKQICARYTWIKIDLSLDPGTSGGGLFKLHGAERYCIGLVQEHQHMLESSRAIGAGAVRSFCDRNHVSLPSEPVSHPNLVTKKRSGDRAQTLAVARARKHGASTLAPRRGKRKNRLETRASNGAEPTFTVPIGAINTFAEHLKSFNPEEASVFDIFASQVRPGLVSLVALYHKRVFYQVDVATKMPANLLDVVLTDVCEEILG